MKIFDFGVHQNENINKGKDMNLLQNNKLLEYENDCNNSEEACLCVRKYSFNKINKCILCMCLSNLLINPSHQFLK